MKQKKYTKRALCMSLLSMLLCCSMLVGTTFAWFTDSVTSGKNQIVAGNLDVELEYATADAMTDGEISEEEWQTVKPETNLFKVGALWEPGYTEYVYLRVRNVGSLALRYRLTAMVFGNESGTQPEKSYTNINNEKFYLSKNLVFNVLDNAKKYESREELWIEDATEELNAKGKLNGLCDTEDQKLYPKGTTGKNSEKVFTLAVYMPTSVGNEANWNGEGTAPEIYLGLTLNATQVPYESDSFGDEYDADAVLVVSGPEGLAEAFDGLEGLAAGSTAVVQLENASAGASTSPVVLDEDTGLTVPEDVNVVLDLNGNDLKVEESETRTGITVGAGSTLTITDTVGDGEIQLSAKSLYTYDAAGEPHRIDGNDERYGILLEGEGEERAQLNIENAKVVMDQEATDAAIIEARNADVYIGADAEIVSSSYGIVLLDGSTATVDEGAKFSLSSAGDLFIVGANYSDLPEESRPTEKNVLNFNGGEVTIDYGNGSHAFQVGTDGEVNMNGGTIEFTGDLTAGLGYSQVFISNGGGTVNMNGGTINANQEQGTVFVFSLGAADTAEAIGYINAGATINMNSTKNNTNTYAAVAQNNSKIYIENGAIITSNGDADVLLTKNDDGWHHLIHPATMANVIDNREKV